VAGLESKEERIESIRPANDLLAHLSFRCFPTFRPVIAGYLKILSDIADGNTDEVEEMIENLKEFRLAEVERHRKLVDLMDWYHLSSVQKRAVSLRTTSRCREISERETSSEKTRFTNISTRCRKFFTNLNEVLVRRELTWPFG
jgi:hypothetical protein